MIAPFTSFFFFQKTKNYNTFVSELLSVLLALLFGQFVPHTLHPMLMLRNGQEIGAETARLNDGAMDVEGAQLLAHTIHVAFGCGFCQ